MILLRVLLVKSRHSEPFFKQGVAPVLHLDFFLATEWNDVGSREDILRNVTGGIRPRVRVAFVDILYYVDIVGFVVWHVFIS